MRSSNGPLLDCIKTNFSHATDFAAFPFCLPIIKSLKALSFPTQITFFVGENGAGKSTLLEALACCAGFGPEGGSKNIHFKTSEEKTFSPAQQLANQLTLSWRKKPKDGYFFRAESFYNLATHLDNNPELMQYYGGMSLHAQSHGESFWSFFSNRMSAGGFFILDEPEAALSPQRQLSLLVIINELCRQSPHTQFIIATHSPILLAYPGATIYSCDEEEIITIPYEHTSHYQITKQFLDNPEQYLKHLFDE